MIEAQYPCIVAVEGLNGDTLASRTRLHEEILLYRLHNLTELDSTIASCQGDIKSAKTGIGLISWWGQRIRIQLQPSVQRHVQVLLRTRRSSSHSQVLFFHYLADSE